MAARGGAPMSEWNQNALVALQGKLKENLTMTKLRDILEKPAGGFMSHAEALRVKNMSGEPNQIEEIIQILYGKDDRDFATFCEMLRRSNYGGWADELELKAETFRNGQGSPGEEQTRVDKLEQKLAAITAEGARSKHIDARVERLEQQMQALTSPTSENTMAENVSDPNETPEAIRAVYKLIVAVDIGTTYTKAAWCWTVTPPAEPEAHHFAVGQLEDQRQVPTAVLYRPSQHRRSLWEFDSFGHEAIHKYREGRPGWALFRTFKMDLHQKKDFDKDIEVRGCTRAGGTVTLPAVRVFCDILVHIKDIILKYMCTLHGQALAKEDIKWVLTVPAMWKASARDVMRQAAKEANIYQIHAPRQLTIALEPESAALHIRSLQYRDLLVGNAVDAKRYIVIDIGGGTIDVAVHAVECHADSGREYVHEIEGCIGSANGATVIDQKFENFLCNLDVPGYPKVFSRIKQKPQVWNDLMANFEKCKVKYEGKSEMPIEMPSSMFVQFPTETSVIFECLVQHKSRHAYINEGSTLLRVSPDICLEWYEPTISSTVELVRELNTKHHVEALFVVGGFAKCKILYQRLEKEFPALQLVVPQDPGFAIIKGAVRYGPLKVIASRTSYATYGIDCRRPFRDGDPLEKRVWSEKNQDYRCEDTFSVFVTKEEELNPSNPYKRTFTPASLNQTSIAIDI